MPWDGRSHYLAAVYRTDLADRIDALVAAGERKMRALIDASDTQQIVLSDSRPLTNVNTDADLRALVRPGADASGPRLERTSPRLLLCFICETIA